LNFKILGSFAIAVVVTIAIGIYGVFNAEIPTESESPIKISSSSPSVDSPIEDPLPVPTIMETGGTKHLIPLDKIRGGGPPKDGIPSIDNPKFAQASSAQFVSDSDVVIGLEINGHAKAYPLFILVWHEIVNDEVGGVPVSITYCPLCYTSQVFERIIEEKEVEFGVSGKLYNSNLLMYDRFTDSYWSQSLGMAVKGELTGIQLKTIPFDLITWGDWKKIHPDSLVLTTDTGHLRAYGVDPYGSYYSEPRIMFPVENKDDRLHAKEFIIGFFNDGVYKAYKQSDIESNKIINDKIGDTPILLVSKFDQNSRAFARTVNNQVLDFEYLEDKIIDTKTKSEWNYDGLSISGSYEGKQLKRMSIHPGFWFEWVAFHPETFVYGDSL